MWKHRFSADIFITVGRQMLKVDGEGFAGDVELDPDTLDSLRRHPNWLFVPQADEPPESCADSLEPEPEESLGGVPLPSEIVALRDAGEGYKIVSATIEELTGGNLSRYRGWDAMINAYTDWFEKRGEVS